MTCHWCKQFIARCLIHSGRRDWYHTGSGKHQCAGVRPGKDGNLPVAQPSGTAVTR